MSLLLGTCVSFLLFYFMFWRLKSCRSARSDVCILQYFSRCTWKKLSSEDLLVFKGYIEWLFFFLLCFSCSYSPSALMAVTMLLLHPEVRLWGTREDHHECRNLLQVGSGRWAPRRARRHGGHHVHGPQPLDPSKWLQVRSPEDHGATQGLRQKDVPAGEGPHRTAAHHWDQASVHHGYWCEQSGATDTILRARAACIYSLFLFQDCVQLNQYKMNKEIGKVSVDIPVIAEVLKF